MLTVLGRRADASSAHAEIDDGDDRAAHVDQAADERRRARKRASLREAE